jgi:hypothetical protein
MRRSLSLSPPPPLSTHDVLTYRTGAAGAPSATRFMAEHLLQQTLPPEMAAMAEYYEQGVAPPTAAEAAASRYAHVAAGDARLTGERLDEIARDEAARLAESAVRADGSTWSAEELTLRALATLTASGLVDRDAALASVTRLTGHHADDEAFNKAREQARSDRDYSSAIATVRRDMNPALAVRLGIEPSKGNSRRGFTLSEVAFLLNGQRADGDEIKGKEVQGATRSLREIFGVPQGERPNRAQLAHILSGRRADGEALPADEAGRAVARFTAAMGAEEKSLSDAEREHMLSGRGLTGAHCPIATSRGRWTPLKPGSATST